MKRLLQYCRWLYRYSEGARGALLGNILLGVATVVLNLVFIWMCKSLVDIATKVRPGPIGWYTAAVFVIIGLRLICSALNLRLENITTARMNFLIRKRIYANLLGSQWTGKERFHTGDTLNRLMSDVDKVTQVICSEFPTLVTTLVQLVAAFAFFCLLEWRLALLLVLVSPAFLAFGKLFFRRMHGITKDIRDSESRIQSHIQESLQHRNVIRSLETGEVMRERLDDLQETEFGQILDRTRFNIFSRTVVGATFNLGYIAAFLWGVYGILHGSVTFGLMTAFLQLVGQIQSPLLRMTHQIPAFVYATASIDRLAELEGAPQEDEGEPIVLEGSCGIRVEHLSFRYPDGEEDIFRDFSFDFAPGSRTAVVGETGVGKSTLIRLMLAPRESPAGRSGSGRNPAERGPALRSGRFCLGPSRWARFPLRRAGERLERGPGPAHRHCPRLAAPGEHPVAGRVFLFAGSGYGGALDGALDGCRSGQNDDFYHAS